MGAARVTYGLGWVLLIIALVERILIMTSPAMAQSAIHRSGRLHAFVHRVVAAPAQFMQQELGVVFGVFDDQDAKGPAHLGSLRVGGGSFMSSQ